VRPGLFDFHDRPCAEKRGVVFVSGEMGGDPDREVTLPEAELGPEAGADDRWNDAESGEVDAIVDHVDPLRKDASGHENVADPGGDRCETRDAPILESADRIAADAEVDAPGHDEPGTAEGRDETSEGVRSRRVRVEKAWAMARHETGERAERPGRERASGRKREDGKSRRSRLRPEVGAGRAGHGARETGVAARGEPLGEEQDLVLSSPPAPLVVEVEYVHGRRQSAQG
jgi:hypothetical protein